jgi:hypothetical protein
VTPEEAAATVARVLARTELAATEDAAVSSTIARAPVAEDEALPVLALDAESGGLRLKHELARGGMGVVHVAEQRSLRREVAVKTSREGGARALLHEARIMGSLEHPNLVPVHSLGADASGAPVLVMKRVTGVSWGALLRDAEHDAWAPLLAGHGDRLRANVEILAQVCRALSFAHERGVVHRDLKPENVMIGGFGEVYLLDWGVALRLAEREREPHAIVGTPGYLAPEMALGDPALADARTDVYLLGATLCEVLTGRMPHEAQSVAAALAKALLGEVEVPDGAPAELGAVVRRAMARDPGDRVQSAEAFRLELTRFLRLRDAELVAAAARAAMNKAEALIRSEGAASADAYGALIEARFGFGSAREMRDDDALTGEQDACIARLVERELALGSVGGARTLLGELSSPRGDLAARADALEAAQRSEREAAEGHDRARREADTSRASGPFLLLGAAAGLPVVLGLWWFSAGDAGGTFAGLLFSDLVLVSFTLGGAALFHKRLLATQGSRRLTAVVLGWCLACCSSDVLT